MQYLECKALPLPFPHLKDEDVHRIGGQAWSQTQAPTPNPIKPCTSTPPKNNNPLTRKAPGPKMNGKYRRTRVPAKRRYKVRLTAQPLPTTPTTSVPVNPIPTPTAAMSNASTKNIHSKIGSHIHPGDGVQLGTGKIQRNSLTSRKVTKNPSASSCNPPQLEATPRAPTFHVRVDTPWPNTMPTSMNLFEARADWPIPPTPAPTVNAERNRSTTLSSSNPSCYGITQTEQ